MFDDRYSSSGQAGSAADRLTAETGQKHHSIFRPRHEYHARGSFDPRGFIVVKTSSQQKREHAGGAA